MKSILIFLTTCILILHSYAQQEKINPARRTTKWVTDVSTQLSYSYPDSSSFAPERKAGKNWVFEYSYHAAEDPQVSDDELHEIIAFEIDPSVIRKNAFSISQADLSKTKAYYLRGCFCKDRGYKLIRTGTISGKKLNRTTWSITFDFVIEGEHNPVVKKYTGRFYFSKK